MRERPSSCARSIPFSCSATTSRSCAKWICSMSSDGRSRRPGMVLCEGVCIFWWRGDPRNVCRYVSRAGGDRAKRGIVSLRIGVILRFGSLRAVIQRLLEATRGCRLPLTARRTDTARIHIQSQVPANSQSARSSISCEHVKTGKQSEVCRFCDSFSYVSYTMLSTKACAVLFGLFLHFAPDNQ